MPRASIGAAMLAAIVWLLLAGCGGSAHNQRAAVRPSSAPQQPDTQANGLPLLGDLDADGSAGVGDAIKILRIVVGLDADSPAADANQNGSTDVGDAIKLLRLVVGLETGWPLTWQRAWVTGVVKEFIDPQTTPPLEGVKVNAGSQSDTTDSSGEFVVKGVLLGDQAIAVAKADYEPAGALPASVLVEAPSTILGTVYMIPSGNLPPPGP